MRQRFKQPKERFLRHIFETFAFSGKPRQRSENHVLMLFDYLLEILQACKTATFANCFTEL